MLPLRVHHWVTLLWICLVLDTVAAVQLPGVAWSKLELWEGSALADVWLRSAEYLEFRTYALSCLSDLAFCEAAASSGMLQRGFGVVSSVD